MAEQQEKTSLLSRGLKRIRKRRYVLRVFMLLLLVALIPLLVLSVIYTTSMRKRIIADTEDKNRNYLGDIVNATNVLTQQIEQTLSSLSAMNVLLDFTKFPYGPYYERVKAPYPEDKLAQMYDYLHDKRDVVQTLRAIQMSNEIFSAVYYIDVKKNIVLDSSGLQSDVEQYERSFRDADPRTGRAGEPEEQKFGLIYRRPFASLRRIPEVFNLTGQMSRLPRGKTAFVDLRYPIIDAYDEINSYLSIYVDVEALHEPAGYLSRSSDDHILVRTDVDNIVRSRLTDASDKLYSEFVRYIVTMDAKSGSLSEGHEEVRLNGTPYLVSVNSDSHYGWTYYCFSSLEQPWKQMATIARDVSLLAFGLLLMAIIFGFAASQRIYRPVNRLLRLIRTQGAQYDLQLESTSGDEFTLLETALRQKLANADAIAEQIATDVEIYREIFLQLLISKPLSGELIRQSFEYFDLGLDPERLRIIVFAYFTAATDPETKNEADWDADTDYLSVSATENASLSAELSDAVTTLFLSEYGLRTCVLNPDNRRLIVFTTQEDADLIPEEAAASLSAQFGMTIRAWSSPVCTDPENICVTYNNLLGNIARETDFPDAVHSESRVDGTVPAETPFFAGNLHVQFVRLLRLEKPAAAEELLRETLKTAVQSCTRVHGLRISAVQICLQIYMAAAELGVYDEMLRRQEGKGQMNIIQNVCQTGSQRELTEVVCDFGVLLFQTYKARPATVQSDYVRRVKEIIARDSATDITLGKVAESIPLSPAYLSRILHEEAGFTFSEHLTRARIQHSCSLLRDTNLTIAEISRRVGYQQANYFVRIFRRHMHVTPGEYRKSYRVDSDSK
ncbi:MAG: helix-turn-helix transcriptional regulator [Clostridiaceae bacterium]|nr:helix-turn-helix transcriptional regulator [Clostridiaceae bacterium]